MLEIWARILALPLHPWPRATHLGHSVEALYAWLGASLLTDVFAEEQILKRAGPHLYLAHESTHLEFEYPGLVHCLGSGGAGLRSTWLCQVTRRKFKGNWLCIRESGMGLAGREVEYVFLG